MSKEGLSENVVKLTNFSGYCVFRSSQPEVFLGKGVLKICSKFTGEHPCRSAISIKLQSILTKNTSGRLLLNIVVMKVNQMCMMIFNYCYYV